MALNRNDCEKVFAKLNLPACNKLVDFTVEPFFKDSKDIRGYLGEHLLLTLIDQNCEKYSFFVKVCETDKGILKCFEDFPTFENEIYVYKFIEEITDKSPKLVCDVIPKLLLCKVTGNDKIMVCENLTAHGYRGSSSSNLKLTYDEIMASLKSLAKYHTVSIAFEQFMKKQKTEKISSIAEYCNDAKHMHAFFIRNEESSRYKYFRNAESCILELAKLIYPMTWNEALQQQIKNSCNEILDLLNDPNDFCKVLAHGDMWAFNLLFKYDKATDKAIDAKIIDFQLCFYAPPAYDVTMLLCCAADANSRKKYLGQFFGFYYKCLQDELAALGFDIKNILSPNEFEETCKLYMPLAKFLWLSYRRIAGQSQENAIDMGKNYKLTDILLGSGGPAYIKHLIEIDAPYVERISVILKEYLEIFEFKLLTIDEIYMIISKKFGGLDEVPDYDLLEYSPQEITQVCGYLGSYWRISITIKVLSGKMANDVKTFKLFAKMLPKTDAQLKYLEETGCGYKEKQFYSDLVQRMTENGLMEIEDVLPGCYLATKDCLVLDDLVNQDNYKMGNVRSSMSVDQVKLVLESMAKLHACGLLLEVKMGRKLTEIYSYEFKEAFYNDLDLSKGLRKAGKLGISQGIEMYCKTSRTLDAEMLKMNAIKYIDNFKNLIQPSRKYRNTICHGDLWANNVLFTADNCKLIDFQSYRYCPCTHDLTQFLFLTMYRRKRVEHWEELLKYYYVNFERVFKNHGYNVGDFMPYEDFLKSVDVDAQFALLQNLTHFQTILLSPEALETYFKEPEVASKYHFEDRSEHVRLHWENDEIYRQRMTEAIDDFREFCLKIC